MQGRKVIRLFFFILFFSVGAASLSGSILCDDLVRYYHNKQIVTAARESSERLKSLNTDYDMLLKHLEKDPNLVDRLARATLGIESEDANTAYPRATAEQLAAARRALMEDPNLKSAEPAMPEWLRHCSEPRRKIAIFFSGAILILISLVCFGPPKQIPEEE